MYCAHRALNGTADHSTVPAALVTVADTQARMSTPHVLLEVLTVLVEILIGWPRKYTGLSVEVVRSSAAAPHAGPPVSVPAGRTP